MKKKSKFTIIVFLFTFLIVNISADTLYTVDGRVYQGKMVAFKYNVIFFNVYKFEKFYRLMRFPLSQVWKMEFNKPKKEGLITPFELEATYTKLRKGKNARKVELKANQKWVDTGIEVRIGQDILFYVSGSINIDEKNRVFPDGEITLRFNRGKPIPNQPTGAVIARVGIKGTLFYVGNDQAPFHMSKKGRLFVGINDFNFEDNTGSFSVTIYY